LVDLGNNWENEGHSRSAPYLRLAGFGAVLLLVAMAVWLLASQTTGEKREVSSTPVVMLTPPPPPPPPPPQEKPPEPLKPIETPTPSPDTPPKPTSAPRAMTEAGPPQAGQDAFGVQSGNGGGMVVGGDVNGTGDAFSEDNYRRYLGSAVQRAIETDDKLSRLTFSALVEIWVGSDGAINKVLLVKSSGDDQIDQALVVRLQTVRHLDQPPPPGVKFPARIALNGRRL
jgi:protein TonB